MSSGCVSWYLFNGFALVENSVVDFFFRQNVSLPWEEVGRVIYDTRHINIKIDDNYYDNDENSSCALVDSGSTLAARAVPSQT